MNQQKNTGAPNRGAVINNHGTHTADSRALNLLNCNVGGNINCNINSNGPNNKNK